MSFSMFEWTDFEDEMLLIKSRMSRKVELVGLVISNYCLIDTFRFLVLHCIPVLVRLTRRWICNYQ